jgi:hypothetical protein
VSDGDAKERQVVGLVQRARLGVDARCDLLDDRLGIVDLGERRELLEVARRAVVCERLLEAVRVEEELVVRLERELDLAVDLVGEDPEKPAVALDVIVGATSSKSLMSIVIACVAALLPSKATTVNSYCDLPLSKSGDASLRRLTSP